MESIQKKRVEWIDICKALTMLAMVFCHVDLEIPGSCKAVDQFVHYWHMPLFFVLSGVVFSTGKYCGWENFGKFFKSRVKSLIVPLLVFGVICGVYNYFMFFSEKGYTWANIFDSILHPNQKIRIYSFQWFLMCLFITETAFTAIYNLVKGKTWAVVAICLAILFGGRWMLLSTGVRLPLTLDSVIYAIPMFMMGVVLRDFFMNKRPLKHPVLQIVGLGLLIALFFWDPGKMNIRQCRYEPFWVYFVGMAATALVIMLIREQEHWITKLKVYPGIKWLGANTLAILVLNGSVRKSLGLGAIKIDNVWVLAEIQFLLTIFVIVIIYLLTLLIKRYAPWMLGKSKK